MLDSRERKSFFKKNVPVGGKRGGFWFLSFVPGFVLGCFARLLAIIAKAP